MGQHWNLRVEISRCRSYAMCKIDGDVPAIVELYLRGAIGDKNNFSANDDDISWTLEPQQKWAKYNQALNCEFLVDTALDNLPEWPSEVRKWPAGCSFFKDRGYTATGAFLCKWIFVHQN